MTTNADMYAAFRTLTPEQQERTLAFMQQLLDLPAHIRFDPFFEVGLFISQQQESSSTPVKVS